MHRLLFIILLFTSCVGDKEFSVSVKDTSSNNAPNTSDNNEGPGNIGSPESEDGAENNEGASSSVSPPAAISMVSPNTTTGVVNTPTLLIAGVNIGAIVKLYKNSACTEQIGLKEASSSSVEITTTSLSTGSHSFYATATYNGETSSCSTASVTYTVVSCPSGYIPISGNSYLGTSDFCVMKFEAKNVSGVPTSQAALAGWNNIQIGPAKTNCKNLTSPGGTANYDLISNREWLTIAYDIEQVASNWSGGSVGSGEIARGHSDQTWSSKTNLAVTNESDPYNGTGNSSSSGWNQKRTQTLSNGEVIWDFAGNLWEWVDWTENGQLVTYSGHSFSVPLSPGCTITSWTEIASGLSSCAGLTEIDVIPNYNSSNDPDLGRASGFGGFINNVQVSGQFTGIRGGASYNGNATGIYAISFGNSYSNTSEGYGYRCVYRP